MLLREIEEKHREIQNMLTSLRSAVELVVEKACEFNNENEITIEKQLEIEIDCRMKSIAIRNNNERYIEPLTNISINTLLLLLKPEILSSLVNIIKSKPLLRTIKFLLEENLKTLNQILSK